MVNDTIGLERKMNINLNEIDITGGVPEKETERQYYYMAKCREQIEKEEKELGRKLTACVNTFGCQMNAGTKIA